MASFERVEGETPNGGDYSEIYYMDKDGNPVDGEVAFKFVLRECKADGTLIHEIFGLVTHGNDDDDDDDD